MPRRITGSRSAFPNSIDDWGQAKENNVCDLATAEDWNKILDAVYNVERHTFRIVQTGSESFTHPVTGEGRPRVLVKLYTVSITGDPSETKTVQVSGFTDTEKNFFGGKPLASGNVIHVSVWRDDEPKVRAYVGAIEAPLSNETGDGGFNIQVAPLLDKSGDTNLKVSSGEYFIALWISRGC